MDLNEKNKYKIAFKKALDTFTEKLEKYVSTVIKSAGNSFIESLLQSIYVITN